MSLSSNVYLFELGTLEQGVIYNKWGKGAWEPGLGNNKVRLISDIPLQNNQ